jgi:hypothetical protein
LPTHHQQQTHSLNADARPKMRIIKPSWLSHSGKNDIILNAQNISLLMTYPQVNRRISRFTAATSLLMVSDLRLAAAMATFEFGQRNQFTTPILQMPRSRDNYVI